jgi:hypothetical protein
MTPAVAEVRFGIEGLGELPGFLFTAFGVACLVGPPLSGVRLDSTHVRWPATVASVGAVIALGAVLPLRATEAGVTQDQKQRPQIRNLAADQ